MSELKILDSAGVPAQRDRWAGFTPPKGTSPFFGWVDVAGDPATIRLESVVTVAKDARSGRWVIILAGVGVGPTIDEQSAYRLMRRMGWTTEGKSNGERN